MSDVVLAADGTAAADGSVLGQGFLGTGQSMAGDLSFIAMGLIAGYIAYSAVRYYLPGFNPFGAIAGALGLSDH